ncbi:LysR substrate-binding domain-containing protein [uncultured Tateyamaria sp.]|uniref:LysR substrate-binding domain-containing protein n=1 Tax=uncultured Tateyamaria sp. TaxID=455651 RepID=UPI00262AC652|nr:LysR substrate-binding domain-containing protein [uncultured Tateyamaria sp.]
MFAHRRYLPSIPALLAFEAAARLGSATAAAQELSLTQSAISRQLKTLEDQIGAQLFARQGRALVLTPVGRSYVGQVRDVLHRLGSASVAAGANPEGGALNLAILPAFGMHWLAPRLADFAGAHPEVTVNLSTRLAPFDFRTQPFDAAIHFGRRDWPGADYLPLMPETVVAVAAPGLVPEEAAPADLRALPLLHLDTRPRAWARWCAAHDIPAPSAPGMVFDQFSTMAQAAIHGLGVALLPTFVAAPHLESGALVPAAGRGGQSIGDYYLVWPADRPAPPSLRSFRAWILTQLPRD